MIKLFTNNEHNGCSTNLTTSFLRTLKKRVITIGIYTLTIIYGTGLASALEMLTSETDVIDIFRKHQTYFLEDDVVIGEYTHECDISRFPNIWSYHATISNNDDLSFIDLMTNLCDLSIDDKQYGQEESFAFQNVDGSFFKKPLSVTITIHNPKNGVTSEKYSFLSRVPKISYLGIGTYVRLADTEVDIPYLLSLTNVEQYYIRVNNSTIKAHREDGELVIDQIAGNIDLSFLNNVNVNTLTIDFGYNTKIVSLDDVRLSNVKSLNLTGNPLEISKYFSISYIMKLRSNGINVYIADENLYTQNAKKIDEALSGLVDLDKLTPYERCVITNLTITSNPENLAKGDTLGDNINIDGSAIICNCDFTEENCGVLNKLGHIDSLIICPNEFENIDGDFLKKLKNVRKVTLKVSSYIFVNVSYEDLLNFKEVEIEGLPADITLWFDNLDFLNLINAGVKLTVANMEEIIQNNAYFEEVYQSLKLSPNASDFGKINAYLEYISKHYRYDPKVTNGLISGMDQWEIYQKYGYLAPIINYKDEPDQEDEKSIICFTYAAIFLKFAKMGGIECFIVKSNNQYGTYTHVFNMVGVGNEVFFIDANYIDEGDNYLLFIAHNQKAINQLEYYNFNPDDKSPDDVYHHPEAIPYAFKFRKIGGKISEPNEKGIFDISNDTFEISIEDNYYIVTGEVLIGILLAMGIAKLVRKKDLNKFYTGYDMNILGKNENHRHANEQMEYRIRQKEQQTKYFLRAKSYQNRLKVVGVRTSSNHRKR